MNRMFLHQSHTTPLSRTMHTQKEDCKANALCRILENPNICWIAPVLCLPDDTHKSNSTLCCGHTPRFCLMVLSSERISLPRMKAVPEVGGNKPVKMDLKEK